MADTEYLQSLLDKGGNVVIPEGRYTTGPLFIRSGTDLDVYVESVNTVHETIHADRGMIYDSNGIVVAQDESTYNIICYMVLCFDRNIV